MKVLQVVKLTETDSRIVGPGLGEREEGVVLLNGYAVSVWEDEKSSGDDCTIM